MASILSTLRVALVAGLVTSLSLGNVCLCGNDAVSARTLRQDSPGSHVCTCCMKTGRCLCGAACHCGQKLPQKDNDPAAPNTSNDRSQPLGLAADFAASSEAIVVAFHALVDLNPLSLLKERGLTSDQLASALLLRARWSVGVEFPSSLHAIRRTIA
jgi:hypothetical protein